MIQKVVGLAGERTLVRLKSVVTFLCSVWLFLAVPGAPFALAQSPDLIETAVRPVKMASAPASLTRKEAVLRVDVNLVLVPVTVNDARNRTVMGLGPENFTLLEDGRQQKIRYFSADDTPISVGVLVDVSDSMSGSIDMVREAVADFFYNANPQDDYFVIAFSDEPSLIANTTQSIGTIQSRIGAIDPSGDTALLDAVHMGLNKLRKARYERRALVIISDGGDNVSRHKLRTVRSMVQESDVQLYAIRVFNSAPFFKPLEEKFGGRMLTDLTEASGGRTIAIDNPRKLGEAAATVSRELRNQYVLGYQPENLSRDGKWHKIKVRATVRRDDSRLHVFAKTGYLAPEE